MYRERDSASEVLIKHLKTMGFNTDGFSFGGPKVSSLQKFVIHRDDTNKVSGLLLEKLREYKNLEVISIKGCENVTSDLSSLSACRHLKKLNCANCPKIFGIKTSCPCLLRFLWPCVTRRIYFLSQVVSPYSKISRPQRRLCCQDAPN